MEPVAEKIRKTALELLASAIKVDSHLDRLIVLTMPRTQRNDNFIDKSFTVMADIILKILPANKKAKEAFVYYRQLGCLPKLTVNTPKPSIITMKL
jgi:hypothetical protein